MKYLDRDNMQKSLEALYVLDDFYKRCHLDKGI